GAEDLDLLPVGVIHTDEVATILRANQLAGEMLGRTPDELVGRNMLEFAVGDLDRYAQMIDYGVRFTQSIMGPLPVTYRAGDGTVRHSTLWARNHLDRPGTGAVVCVLV